MEELNRNKRIAKNTLFLYLRMVFVMFVSIYTVRINLKNLGVDNYGIYNIIAGVIVLFSFITNFLSAATSRYLNFALGENDEEKARDVFSVSLLLHFFICIIVLFFAETVGLWLVNHYLVIPEERLKAANIVYQFSIITTVLGLTKIPYNAAVISYEKMSFYAIMSIFECLGKLFIAFCISKAPFDVLVFYSFLMMLVSVVNLFIFKFYANKNFKVCHFRFVKNRELYKELVSFSGWSLLSSVGSVCSNQGYNMIMNHFCGVVANAAIGIANQVNNAVYQLISNFQVAFEPQITKSYASKEINYLNDLLFKTSKFSFYLLWFFVLPLGLNVDIVLKVWLTEIPEYSRIFLRLILIYSLIDALTGPLWMVAYAIGNIRNYQIVSFSFPIVLLPIVYFCFNIGLPPYIIIVLKICSNSIFSIWRLGYLKKRMDFPVRKYLLNVLFPCFIVVIVTLFISYFVFMKLKFNVVLQFFISCTVTVIANISSIWFIGCSKDERKFLLTYINKIIDKVKK